MLLTCCWWFRYLILEKTWGIRKHKASPSERVVHTEESWRKEEMLLLRKDKVIEDFTALDPFGMVTWAPRYLKALPLLVPPVGKEASGGERILEVFLAFPRYWERSLRRWKEFAALLQGISEYFSMSLWRIPSHDRRHDQIPRFSSLLPRIFLILLGFPRYLKALPLLVPPVALPGAVTCWSLPTGLAGGLRNGEQTR